MPVMAVNKKNPHEQTGDYRSRPRWSDSIRSQLGVTREGRSPTVHKAVE
jgi:hypothetical protein